MVRASSASRAPRRMDEGSRSGVNRALAPPASVDCLAGGDPCADEPVARAAASGRALEAVETPGPRPGADLESAAKGCVAGRGAPLVPALDGEGSSSVSATAVTAQTAATTPIRRDGSAPRPSGRLVAFRT